MRDHSKAPISTRKARHPNNRFDKDLIARFRMMSVEQTALTLGLYCKQDKEYRSTTHKHSSCFHISKDSEVFEIITTELKWYSTHRGCGGGGGIDLAMHLFGECFKAALLRLSAGLEKANGSTDDESLAN